MKGHPQCPVKGTEQDNSIEQQKALLTAVL
jgi:hypothetical protein